MNREELERAETRFVRARVLDHMLRARYRVVVEGMVADDGWLAEFLGASPEGDLVLLAQKPFDAPYLVLATSLDLGDFRRDRDLPELLELSSDHDLSPYFSSADRDLLQLSARLPLIGLEASILDFWLGNLLACRGRIAERFPVALG
ncbi:MAG: hypothetical protein H6807_01265 [Planctomycetes bacterium]|nr:hypothetical protein [Planctomycetota bacterium]